MVPVNPTEVIGKHVLVVEDIFDSGSTIMKIKEKLETLTPKTLHFATLFHKKNPKNIKHLFFAEYIGFVIPEVFVIGYGMDYNEYYRDLSHLCVINKQGIENFKWVLPVRN